MMHTRLYIQNDTASVHIYRMIQQADQNLMSRNAQNEANTELANLKLKALVISYVLSRAPLKKLNLIMAIAVCSVVAHERHTVQKSTKGSSNSLHNISLFSEIIIIMHT